MSSYIKNLLDDLNKKNCIVCRYANDFCKAYMLEKFFYSSQHVDRMSFSTDDFILKRRIKSFMGA